MIVVLIIGIIVLLISLGAIVSDESEIAYFLGVLGAWLVSGALMWMTIHRYPTAMDVYQGKTTIEITYKDGVPIDSVVVFIFFIIIDFCLQRYVKNLRLPNICLIFF